MFMSNVHLKKSFNSGSHEIKVFNKVVLKINMHKISETSYKSGVT